MNIHDVCVAVLFSALRCFLFDDVSFASSLWCVTALSLRDSCLAMAATDFPLTLDQTPTMNDSISHSFVPRTIRK